MEKAKVYFTRDISSEGLVRIYEALNIDLKGRVGVKISTGELGGHNYLKPELIKDLVQKLNGTIIVIQLIEAKDLIPLIIIKLLKNMDLQKLLQLILWMKKEKLKYQLIMMVI